MFQIHFSNWPIVTMKRVELLMCLCFLQGCSAASTCLRLFIEDVYKLLDSFNSVKRAAAGKALPNPLSDNSPHIDHWTKASMGIRSWIFLNYHHSKEDLKHINFAVPSLLPLCTVKTWHDGNKSRSVGWRTNYYSMPTPLPFKFNYWKVMKFRRCRGTCLSVELIYVIVNWRC